MKTNSPRPRFAGYRSVGNAITLVAATRRLLLVRSGHGLDVAVAAWRWCNRTNPAALATLNTVDRSLSCLAATNWSPRRRARFHSTDVLAVAGVRK